MCSPTFDYLSPKDKNLDSIAEHLLVLILLTRYALPENDIRTIIGLSSPSAVSAVVELW